MKKSDTYVFKGRNWRAQLWVCDLRDWYSRHPHNRPEGESGLSFSVNTLRATSNPNTAFSKGQIRYHGGSFSQAWAAVQRFTGMQTLPAKLEEYFLMNEED